jgi:hypothetical protein
VSVVHSGSQIVTILESEVVGVAGGSSVAHLHELFVSTLDIAVARLNSILDGTGDWVVNAQDGTLDKLDLSRVITLQATTSASGSGGLLSTNPAVVIVIVDSGSRAGEAAVAAILAILIERGVVGIARARGRQRRRSRSVGFCQTVGRNRTFGRCSSTESVMLIPQSRGVVEKISSSFLVVIMGVCVVLRALDQQQSEEMG